MKKYFIFNSWTTGRPLRLTWSMEQLGRCGLPSWQKKALCHSTALTPAGKRFLFLLFLSLPLLQTYKTVFHVFAGLWSLFTSVLVWWRESLFIGMLHPRPCLPMGQTTPPTKVSAHVDSPACWTSAAVATVSFQDKYTTWFRSKFVSVSLYLHVCRDTAASHLDSSLLCRYCEVTQLVVSIPPLRNMRVSHRSLFGGSSKLSPDGWSFSLSLGFRLWIVLFHVHSTESPVFISHPHFFNADPVLLDYVDGLHPNEEEHGLFIDIHPVSTQTLHRWLKH